MYENDWIIYLIIGAFIVITLVACAVLFELLSRAFRQPKELAISDGGPPATPSHQFSYTFQIKATEASHNFDAKHTVIRMDLLDNQNRFLSCLAIPSFAFKLNTRIINVPSTGTHANTPLTPEQNLPSVPNVKNLIMHKTNRKTTTKNKKNTKTIDTSLSPTRTPSTRQLPKLSQAKSVHQTPTEQRSDHNSTGSNAATSNETSKYKSLTNLHSIWQNVPKQSTISFYLIRRNPLYNFSSVRLSHDCFNEGSYIRVKHIKIRDDVLLQVARIKLDKHQKIYATHPCPPSGYQVFNAELMK